MAASMPPPFSGSATATTASSDSQSPSLQESLTTCPPSETPLGMKPPMGPPPPKSPNESSVQGAAETDSDPLPESDNAGSESSTDGGEGVEDGGGTVARVDRNQPSRPQVPYKIPPWSAAPCHAYSLEILKDGLIIDQLDITKKGAYMFGRIDLCDFVLENPTVSRFHAVLQFKESGEAYLYDLGSSHGSFLNKNQVKPKVYVDLHVGDVIRFGLSTRLYIFQGPTDLMPPEADIRSIRHVKYQLERQDREASLRRAKAEAALADGISWGMGEDAIEEDEDEVDEITWQTYKGQLTEKQEKTRSKVLKRLEKIAHMKKEMDAIRAKDIPQGGLTQGQQTQIARNEQRISQLMDELESLEETLNDSIRESLGARTKGNSYGKKKIAAEDDEDLLSDDEDEFYDRTKKKPSVNKSQDTQIVETADTLLDKKEIIMKEMEEKTKLLHEEKNKISEPPTQSADDALDAYMSDLSSQLKHDTAEQIQKQISSLQTDLDRVLYLLSIADPTGDAAKKREARSESSQSKELLPTQSVYKKAEIALPQVKKISKPVKPASNPDTKKGEKIDSKADVSRPKVFTVEKPQWLGAVKDESEKSQKEENSVDTDVGDDGGFVDYKDRSKVLSNTEEVGLEDAAPGLIIRKKKKKAEEKGDDGVSEESTSTGTNGLKAEDAVALLLKHKRGYQDSDEAANEEDGKREDNKRPKTKRVLGPAKPAFLNSNTDYEEWVPPQGQSGDGRTSLNDRLGY